MELHQKICPTRSVFVSQIFERGDYQGEFENKLAREIHDFLHLGDSTTDYYLMGALMSLLSLPSELTSINQYSLPWLMLGQEGARCHNGVLVGVGTLPVKLCWHPETLPESILYSLDPKEDGYMEVKQGSKLSTITYSIGPSGEIVFHEDFSAAFPVGLRFSVAGWSSGQIRISIPPLSYPYAAVAEGLQKNNSALMLLNKHGLLEAFASTVNPMKKVAYIVLCLTKEPIKLA